MPKGTRVDRCFQKKRREVGASSAAAICQASTGQNLHTGRPLKRQNAPKPAAKRKGVF